MSDTVEDLRRKLIRANTRGAWPSLIETARRMAEQYPAEWEPHVFESRGLIELGRYEEAEHLLLLAMDRFPRIPMLAVMYGEAGTRRLIPDAAVARWQGLLRRLPDVPNVYLGLAHAYNAAKQPDQAVQTIEHGIERLPDSLELLQNRAELAWQNQDWDAALAGWTAVHDRAPGHENAASFRIRALARLGRFPEADALAESEIERRSDDVELAVSYATTSLHSGDGNEAIRRWRLVHELAPSYPFGALGLARALGSQERYDEADAVLLEGLEHNLEHPALLAEYAAMAGRARKWEVAADRWKAVYDRGPAQTKTYLEYAKALEQALRLDQADEIAAEGVGFAPDQPALHRRYAGVATLRGDNVEALRRWEEAADRFPDDAAIAKGLAKARKAVERDTKLRAADETAESARQHKTSIPEARIPTSTRAPHVGPTALDLLLTGAPAGDKAIPQPEPTGLAGVKQKLRRLFGR